jgi:hypothetical protein
MLRTIRLLALALAAIALFTACSGAASTPGVATLDDPSATMSPGASPAASKDPQEAMLAYAQCMRENGVDMPDPQVVDDGDGQMGFSIGGPGNDSGGRQPSKDEFEKADSACRHFLANMVQDKGGPQMSAEDQDKVLAFARCMREHGVDMPDPDFSGGGVMIKGGPGDGGSRPDFDPSSDEFQAAQEACQSLLPGGGLKGGGDGPSTNLVPEGSVYR